MGRRSKPTVGTRSNSTADRNRASLNDDHVWKEYRGFWARTGFSLEKGEEGVSRKGVDLRPDLVRGGAFLIHLIKKEGGRYQRNKVGVGLPETW